MTVVDYSSSETTEEETVTEEATTFADGDVIWDYTNSFDKVRKEVEDQLNESTPHPTSTDMAYGYAYWVEDINSSEALVCHQGKDYFVVPYKSKRGNIIVSEKEDWKPVEKAWVETNLADEPQQVSELFFDDPTETKALEEDGLIWKSIMREGEWAYTPGPKGPIKKAIKIVKSGFSDRSKNIISLDEIKSNFEENVIENVTVPLSHKDQTHENTGYVRKMRFGKDTKGRNVLEAGLEITEPEIKGKILRGTIANTSAGVLWDYVKKGDGKKFNTAMNHLALTNHPWLDELAPFSDNIDNNSVILSFSEHEITENMEVITLSNDEENTNIELPRGGEDVSTDTQVIEPEVITVVDRSFFEELNLSEDDIRSIVSDYTTVKEEQRKTSIDTKGKDWQEAGKSPALVKAAKEILFADDETLSINFSEDGATKTLSLADVVERLVEASPSISLEDQISEEDAAGNAPDADASKENERANFSEEVLSLAGVLYIDEGLSEEAALKEAAKRLGNKE